MQDLLKSKMILYFAAFGFVFSFLLGLVSRGSVFALVIRSIISGLIMGIIGFGVEYFLKTTLSEEDYYNLFQSSKNNNPIESDPLAAGKKVVDMMDDSSVNGADAYTEMYSQRNTEQEMNSTRDEVPVYKASKPLVQETPIPASFQEDDFTTAPRVKAFEEQDSSDPHDIKEDLNKLGEARKEEQMKRQPAASSIGGEGTISFKVKNKTINADPQIIAKAIKTVLHKD